MSFVPQPGQRAAGDGLRLKWAGEKRAPAFRGRIENIAPRKSRFSLARAALFDVNRGSRFPKNPAQHFAWTLAYFMKLSRKIEKLINGEAWKSLVDKWHAWRRPLCGAQMARDLEAKGFERIRQKYENNEDPKAWPKYVQAERWLSLAIRQARALRLDRGAPRRILDIGSGAGYFLYVCKQLGHEVCGLDLDFPPMYAETFELMGLRRVIWRINAFQPLPDLGGRFDLVTAFAVCFNCHASPEVWGPKEWEFFLDDLEKNVLAPGGEVYFELNPEKWGRYTPELREFFLKRGAQLDERSLRLKSRVPPPVH